MGRVLVVDDEQSLRDVLEVLIAQQGHSVRTASGVDSGVELLDSDDFDLVVTDLRLEPDGDGMDIVRAARRVPVGPEVIVMTAFGTPERAIEAHDIGALFYVQKGPKLASDMGVLVPHAVEKRRLKVENERLRSQLSGRSRLGGVIGKSAAMAEVFQIVDRIAPTKVNVLLVGESGTGKERLSRSIHMLSERHSGPFVPLNCGAIPPNLMESELFGHEKGAFTGADSAKRGMFQAAGAGTIFLDEIAELPIELQPKLLRVLQERKVKPIGATAEFDVDVRVIAATNRDLEAEVRAGRFREDLYFRLNVVQIDVPPLRERLEDLPLLARTFLQRFASEYAREVTSIGPEVMSVLLGSPWPGNVRELENVIERAVALARGAALELCDLPKGMRAESRKSEPPRRLRLEYLAELPDEGLDLEGVLEDLEAQLLSRAMLKAAGVKTKAAELLGLSFRQFRYKLGKNRRFAEMESEG